MIEINKSLPLSNLKNLNIEQIAITSNPYGGFLAFLDFENEFALSSEKIDECLEELEKNRKANQLSFSGWIGFFVFLPKISWNSCCQAVNCSCKGSAAGAM